MAGMGQLPLSDLPIIANPITLFEAKKNIESRHLFQLANVTLKKETTPPPEPMEGPDELPGKLPHGLFGSASSHEDLLQWSKENATQIKEAVKNRAFGGPNGCHINWTNVFLPFMEAATVYLRDSEKVLQAAEAAKRGEVEAAFALLRESTDKIQEVAALWGMEFFLLCDLTEDGSWLQNGPFCGAFYSKDPDAPFMGIAFKGTNIRNLKDIYTDINIFTVETKDILYNTTVSKGVYNGMFQKFHSGQAFEMITQGLNELISTIPNAKGQSVVTHVTGHSLGGSYSDLCYTQLTVPSTLPPLGALGDLYTFGCPRIGYENFASALKEHLGPKTGSSWRVANTDDVVPQLPPLALLPWQKGSKFNHVDTGYQISTSNAPKKLPTEIGTLTPTPKSWKVSPHYVTSYYPSLRKAMFG